MPIFQGIDHTLLGVRDLERARMGWTRLGFTLSPRGRHIGWGTANYCVMFPSDYIELLGIVDPAQFTNRLDVFLARREGLMGIALATSSAQMAAADLTRRGLHPQEPRDLARQLELPEGTALPRFKLVHLPPEETPALSAFVCEHVTPELLRRPQWLVHANGAIGLKSIAVVVPETGPLQVPYERIFGAAVNTTDDVLTVHVGAHRILFVTPDDLTALFPGAELDVEVDLPVIAAMELATRDPAATLDHMTQWHIHHEELADGTVVVPPEEANGAALVFSRA